LRKRSKQPAGLPDLQAVDGEIRRICGLDLGAARIEWRAAFKKEPSAALSCDFLQRQLTWHIQERAFGGYDPETLLTLKAYARRDPSKVVLFKRLKPGTAVVREYQGVRHIVTISDSGYVWEGRTFDSLSVIARQITGARWNGPRFFGLRAKDKDGVVERAS
jgi:hypothetical protein